MAGLTVAPAFRSALIKCWDMPRSQSTFGSLWHCGISSGDCEIWLDAHGLLTALSGGQTVLRVLLQMDTALETSIASSDAWKALQEHVAEIENW